MANDPTVKAGSWGAATVEKIIRIQERAAVRCGSRWSTWSTRPGRGSPTRSQMFPGRRGAGRIFHNQVRAVGRGPAGLRAVRAERRRRRLHPGVLRRRDHGRRQRLDVPRLAADGRDGDRREGHARGDGRRADAHHDVSGCGHLLAATDDEAHRAAPAATSRTCPSLVRERRRRRSPAAPAVARPTRRRDPGRREPAVRHARR